MNGRQTAKPGELPVYEGADRLLKLIGALYQRPGFGDRPRELDETSVRWGELVDRTERPGRKGLPMVCLVRPEGPANQLTAVDDLLDHAKPHGVRHALVTLSDTETGIDDKAEVEFDVRTVQRILREARNKLIDCPKVRGVRPRFPLFTLVDWLLVQEKEKNDLNPEGTLRRKLQRQGNTQRVLALSRTAAAELPDDKFWWKVPVWVLMALTVFTFRIAVTGRVPVLSGRYRWFLRQPHLAPEMSGSFVRFAERLVNGEWQKESAEYVARLLVNSFLEDLRRDCRLRPWQLFRRRRMTYPVLLLDRVTMRNGGFTLLRLINDVRNQVGTFDPLLVISASDTVPPDGGADDPRRPYFDAETAIHGYRTWQGRLLADRRARRDTAWYLPIGIPAPDPPGDRSRATQRLDAFDGYTVSRAASRPSFWLSVPLRITVVVVLLAGAGAGVLTQRFAREGFEHAHCGTTDTALVWTGSECVGVSDGSDNLFSPSDSTIQQVVDTIDAQNQRAAALHAQFPQRPYVTLAYLESLTSSSGTSDGLTAERESLEGVAVAQQRQLSQGSGGSTDPIVRVLIANGGLNMDQGANVAAELGELAQRDPTLVGVVGLDMSRQPTVNAINALSAFGLPMVAATLTADSLADDHPLYFQVAPQNSREAAVVAAWAQQYQHAHPNVPDTVTVYYSDDASDIYSSNLRNDAENAFGQAGLTVNAVPFSPGQAYSAGQQTCSDSGFVFFAGRGVPDYGDFLNGASQCDSQAVFVGDDDVSRYVADAQQRQANRTPSFYYVTFSPAPASEQMLPTEQNFYSALYSLFPFDNLGSISGRSLDMHAALTYDAAEVMITATRYLRQDGTVPITPAGVWREITDIHKPLDGSPDNSIDGVSGVIDYGGDITRQVPLNKPVAIMQVQGGNVNPNVIAYCGDAIGRQEDSWCPQDHDSAGAN